MPSRAVGMGMCPRCGKPGTVVIKAGNYVYVKHGNTWHYIGTIDKVNLNKILIKDEKILEKIKENNIKYIGHKSEKIKNISTLIIITTIITIGIASVLLIASLKTYKLTMNNNKNSVATFLTQCHAVMSSNNSIFLISCNNATDNINASMVNISYETNLKKYNITIINK